MASVTVSGKEYKLKTLGIGRRAKAAYLSGIIAEMSSVVFGESKGRLDRETYAKAYEDLSTAWADFVRLVIDGDAPELLEFDDLDATAMGELTQGFFAAAGVKIDS